MLPKISGIFRIHTKEQKFLQDGTSIVTLNIVASSKYKTKAGQEKEDVCWISATSFGKQSEIIAQYFNEKDRIYIVGDLKQDSWTTQSGEKRSRHTLKIDSFEFIERKSDQQQQPSNQYQGYQQQPQQQGHSTSAGMNNPSPQMQQQYNNQQNPPVAQHLPNQNQNTMPQQQYNPPQQTVPGSQIPLEISEESIPF